MKNILMMAIVVFCLQSQGFASGRFLMEEIRPLVRGFHTIAKRTFDRVMPVSGGSVTFVRGNNVTGNGGVFTHRYLSTWMRDLNSHLSELPSAVTLEQGAREVSKFIQDHEIDRETVIKEAKENCSGDLVAIGDPVLNYCAELFRSVYSEDSINQNIPRKRLDEIGREILYTFQENEKEINSIVSEKSPSPPVKNTVMKIMAAIQMW